MPLESKLTNRVRVQRKEREGAGIIARAEKLGGGLGMDLRADLQGVMNSGVGHCGLAFGEAL